MKKSIFARYFYLIVITCVFCCALIASIQLLWVHDQEYDRSYDKMRSISRLIIADITDAYSADSVDVDQLRRSFENYALTYSISCYMFDEGGSCLISTDYYHEELPTLGKPMMQRVSNVPFFDVADLSVNDSGERLNACYVELFHINEGEEIENRYIALLCPAEEVNGAVQELFWVTVVCLLVAALLIALLSYFFTRRLTRPIQHITEAAEKFAAGEFSYRLTTSGHDELDYLALTMNRMADFIDTNERNRKSFVSNVSHELRTPMTTIGGFVDGMLDGTIPEKEQSNYLKRISGEIKRLSRLVNSMLNISKFEEGEMELNRVSFDISSLLISTLFMFEQKIEAKRVSVEGLEECGQQMIFADKDLIQQVLYNLIENAVKFINIEGTLSFAVEEEEKNVLVHIRNSGEGLSEDEISHVFDRFYKTDASRGKDVTGVGLGLSIVSRIVRLHEGRVLVKSVQGEYTEFIIRLPLKGKR